MKILKMALGPLQGNCYIVYDEDTKDAIVIDPGHDGHKVAQVLKDRDLNAVYFLLTHGHVDHIGGLPELKEIYPDVPVVLHEDDRDLLDDPGLNLSLQAIGKAISMKPDKIVSDGDTLEFAHHKIEVLHTPGHTKGGICFKIDDDVFTGDTLFRDSIGRSDFYGGDGTQLIESILNKLMVLPDETNIYPGHMERSTIGREKESNMFISPYFRQK